jgi:hypothetical protein
MPAVLPIATISVLLSGIRNFELVFLLGEPLNGNLMFELMTKMIQLHKRFGGRSEFRYGSPGPNTPLFMDCAMSAGFESVFSMLHNDFGIKQAALHPGKFSLPIGPLKRVPLAQMYGMVG